MKKEALPLLLTLIVFLQSCATTYKGTGPNLNLKGLEAKEELNQYIINDSYWSQSALYYQMGPDNKVYTISSLEPVVEKVSPDASKTLSDGAIWKNTAMTLSALSLVGVLVFFTSSDDDTKSAFLAGGVITGLTSSVIQLFVILKDHVKAANEYNRDLSKKLSPGLGIKLDF